MGSIDSQFPPIYTDRLVLRAFDPSRRSDYDDILAFYNSEYTRKSVGDLGVHTYEDVDARSHNCRPFPANQALKPPPPTHPFHLVYLRATDALVGMTCLLHRRPLPYPDLGYAIIEEHAGQGFATEAGKATLKWWTEEIGIENIWVGMFDTNTASKQVATKIGFVDGGMIKVLLPNGATRNALAFVQPHMGRCLDGLEVHITRNGE